VVSSSVDPHLTFEKFLEPNELPADFLEGVRRYKFRGSSGKVNLALDALPNFKCLPGPGAHLRGAISISPSMEYMERAYDDAKYGHYSRRPYIDMVIPSLTDPSVAPPGKHVLSCFVQYAPYKLVEGTWDDQKEAFGDNVINTIAEYAPNIKDIVIGRQVLTPLDLEREFGLTQGNIFQGELSLEQLFFLRPVAGWAYYRTPIRNLYMCGSATHPGGGITEEFHHGFRASTLTHTLGPLRANVARDLQLDNFECEILYPAPRVFAPTPDSKALLFYNDVAKTAAEIARISAKDSAKYAQFASALEETAGFFTQLSSITPPAIDKPTPEDLWSLLKTGRSVRSLGKSGIFDLLRWGPMAVADFVAEFFETELLRAVIAARGIFGAALGPWSAGSTAVLLLRAAADVHPVGSAAFPRGGLGSFTRALAESAKQAGAEIRTDAEVRHILIKDGAVTGIVLADGEEIAVEAVVSGVDPKRTFFQLVDPTQLDPTFANRMKNFRANGTVAKVNLALASLPAFTALDATEGFLKALSGRIHIGPEIDYLERAFDASKYG